MRRLSCCFVAGRWNVRFVPLMPMRSTVPYSFLFSGSRAGYTANLMLEEPPLIVRMHGSAGFMLGSFVRQSERTEFRAGGPVIRKDAPGRRWGRGWKGRLDGEVSQRPVDSYGTASRGRVLLPRHKYCAGVGFYAIGL